MFCFDGMSGKQRMFTTLVVTNMRKQPFALTRQEALEHNNGGEEYFQAARYHNFLIVQHTFPMR